MSKKLGLQLYSVRDHMTTVEETRDTFKKLVEYGYTEAQTAGFGPTGVEDFSRLLKEYGLKVVGTHWDLDTMYNNPDEAYRVHELLGTTNMGIGGMPHLWDPNGPTAEQVKECIDKMNTVAARIASRGMKFTYHHHQKEFQFTFDGETLMDKLVRELDPQNITFVLDTHWLKEGGADVCAYIRKLAGRVDILHLKDMAVLPDGSHRFAELGSGTIDFKEVLKAGDEAGVKHYCYEMDAHYRTDSLESAKESAAYFHSIA